MTSKEKLRKSLNHQQPEKVVVDFGATSVSGIHVRIVELLRKHFNLPNNPVKVCEPYQMLGEIDIDLLEKLGGDVVGLSPYSNMFGIPNDEWKAWKTPWGQEVLIPGNFNTTRDASGNTYIYPEGDTAVNPSAKMPAEGYFFDALNRQGIIDDENLNVEDNLEEFGLWSDEDKEYWKKQAKLIGGSEKGIVANFGGTALGDIALVPAMQLKYPKGIRDVSEWYMSSMMRPDYIKAIFDRQSDIAVQNLQKAYEIFGNTIDALFICGTDFGTQDSTFCAPESFVDIWMPFYQKINNWIHEHTEWKTFKHSCGAVEPFMNLFIEAGFDIINPVQINAKGMDPKLLKAKYGNHLTFWGGGIDTQQVLPFGTPAEVKKQVIQNCSILAGQGGFVFNTVHNIQANTPIENVMAMLEALEEVNAR